ncbi:hypothetical protein [Microbacterium sp. A84]|uniref:hypothetical protein n=1 Tax=Microbacterium sp. A84 TaxID=3450715 RepID=UPI003F43A0F9
MAMNLRLRDDAVVALRAESERTGLSQQEILRLAVDEHLGISGSVRAPAYPEWVTLPERVYRPVTPALRLPDGLSTADLLDRDDRV